MWSFSNTVTAISNRFDFKVHDCTLNFVSGFEGLMFYFLSRATLSKGFVSSAPLSHSD